MMLQVWPGIYTVRLLHPSSIFTYRSMSSLVLHSAEAHISTLDINPFLARAGRLLQLIHPVASLLYCKIEHGEQRRRHDKQERVSAVWHFGNCLGGLARNWEEKRVSGADHQSCSNATG